MRRCRRRVERCVCFFFAFFCVGVRDLDRVLIVFFMDIDLY